MIYKSDLIDFLTKNSDRLDISLDVNNNLIYDKSGNMISTIDDYLEMVRLKEGCSFSSIYYSHAFLKNILKCNKCGTIIFTKEDEEFDPKLKCPTCTSYETYFIYYTKEQIENNNGIKNAINAYIELSKYEQEAREYEEKHGHPYWQILNKKIYIKNYMYNFVLNCDDIRKSCFKGLYLKINYSIKDKTENFYIYKKQILIPLSFKMIYAHWLYPIFDKFHIKKRRNKHD